jgi:hypothetical protein
LADGNKVQVLVSATRLEKAEMKKGETKWD